MGEIGIRKTHDNLRTKLSDYIKAQYFAENDLLINASKEILNKKGILYQEPYIEMSKSYKQSDNGFATASMDEEYKDILNELATNKLGVFNTPFIHQLKAVEHFYNKRNVLVTTGTGSGKTECFLWPILTNLIYEARYQSESWEKEGIRALVLYPMNALVSDQLGRLRNIIGREDDVFNKILCKGENRRRARFGMYTGRTPYSGLDDEKKNRNLAKVIDQHFMQSDVYGELKKIGRIPSKDMMQFKENLARGMQVTGSNDSELYTRNEMHKICPDILVTNYSMLEYMLMRPIEDSFWSKTIDWLNLSKENSLLLVIDEAHMYRGAPGGEVSLLIRRLMDRLKIDSSKMRCILTSASVPKDKNDDLQNFTCGLIGAGSKDSFAIVREELETINGYKLGSDEEARFYSSLSLVNLQGNLENKVAELSKLAEFFSHEKPEKNEDKIQVWLYNLLKSNPLINQILHICNNGGKSLSAIAKECFEDGVPEKLAEKALEILLQLGIMSKSETGKVLMGSKVHMLFRGLQGLYVCVNPNCKCKNEGMGINLGYLTNESREICPECNCRMFEIMIDRRCGTIYLRAFIDDSEYNNNNSFDFLWSKRNKIIREPKELHLWPVPSNRKDFFKLNKSKGKANENSVIGYLDAKTGMLFQEESHEGDETFLKVLISELFNKEMNALTFGTCPNCGKDHNRITPFVTRGNEPFANIVKEQFESQVIKDDSLKNNGKKVLLFSDSRQRAATLARDMTIAADGDAGRQAIFMSQKLLDKSRDSIKTIDSLYYAFLKVVYDNKLNFFYGKEKEIFGEHLNKYKCLHADKKNVRFNTIKRTIGSPPDMFYQLLLKNISDSYRSYNNLGLGQIVLAETEEGGEIIEGDILEKVVLETGISLDDIRKIYNAWVQYLVVRKVAIFPEIGDDVRNSILSYERGGFGIDEKPVFPGFVKEILKAKNIEEKKIDILLENFELLCGHLEVPERNHNRKYILASWLELKTAENSIWWKCDRCAGMSTYTLWGHCIYCGSDKHVREVDKEHLQRYSLWTKPVHNAIAGERIRNITTEEHTAQLSHKDEKTEVWGTTEKYELAFRNIAISDDNEPIDILSCTTTMEVGIDIGSLTSVGLRNVPPMRENYQQRAGRAGRAGAAVSSIVTYTENGPHDAWYFNHPNEIISGEPRSPWIDTQNIKLIKRHVNLILLQGYFREKNVSIDVVYTADFFNADSDINYLECEDWVSRNIPFDEKRESTLIPIKGFDWHQYKKELINQLNNIFEKVKDAEFIYNPATTDESRSNAYKLMDVLFTEGLLPNYSFPRNIVNFWIEDMNGKVKESPERSIDIALSEYAPGRSLVVDKQTYISGGLFDYYTKFKKDKQYKAAEPWLELDEYKKSVQCCSNSACGWFGVNEGVDICPLCGGILKKHTMIKPWGFAAREGKSISEIKDSQEISFASKPSYSSMPSGKKMESVGSSGYLSIENRDNQKLVIINKGPEEDGFELCYECGAVESATTNEKERQNRKRPYRIPYKKDDSMKCRHDYQNIYLGYEFNTDMMVLEIKLDNKKVDLVESYALWLIPALTTFSETLALAASIELDVEFNDMRSGYRIRAIGGQLCADIYLYDSLSSGAGYAKRVTEFIDVIMLRMEELMGDCDCNKACPNCLQHFGNQRERENLDRYIGIDFLKFVRDGDLKTCLKKEEQQVYFDELNKIAILHEMDPIIDESYGKYWLNTINGKREIIVYPSMYNIREHKVTDKIYLSDGMCKNAISEIWKIVHELL
ncbi:DEAD/DEAH box helicase [Fusibacter sp. 3D3]|uniref:DEAD/DEAH box helicase n=1 Tax=Fusibacter sp. 3D3 TaxID=1048380 RepID=UPI000853B0EE|nr:DEAD/DEAH box helicase [Fusibacter sp. 3D3]GAU78663.1 DEAD/DEAH box helicase-like [Fusibacter sp. 3D3]